jgi:hypothetical protein
MSWPEWAEVQRLTIVVAVFSIICIGYMGE